MRLTTGRLRDHWHGMSRTGTVASLFGHVPEPRVGLNASDMARRGIEAGGIVRVESRRGELHVIAEADESIRSGQAWLPMHWGKRYLGGKASAGVNGVTCPAFDPVSKQPELKHAAVKIVPVELPWRATAFAECGPGQEMEIFDRLQSLQSEVIFASAVLIGRDRPGVLLRAGHNGAPGGDWLERLDAILDLDSEDVLRYEDPRRGQSRRMRLADDRLLAVRLSGDAGAIASGEWLREWLVGGRSVAEVRRLLLSPAARAPSGFVSAGRVVCQCFNVAEAEIEATLAQCTGDAAARVRALGDRLGCGTNCGSCKPELRALALRATAAQPEAKVA
jgi:assimilatory nitrate reductase catalytic subunit